VTLLKSYPPPGQVKGRDCHASRAEPLPVRAEDRTARLVARLNRGTYTPGPCSAILPTWLTGSRSTAAGSTIRRPAAGALNACGGPLCG